MADPGSFAGPGHPDAAGWALGVLDPQESSRFQDHLESCPECQQAVAEFTAVTRLLKTAAELPAVQLAEGPEPPPDLQTRTLGRIERAARKAAWRRWSPRRTLSAAGAAVVAAAAAITVILAQSGPALAFSIPLHP
jgi:anti-sigma factor RsiW